MQLHRWGFARLHPGNWVFIRWSSRGGRYSIMSPVPLFFYSYLFLQQIFHGANALYWWEKVVSRAALTPFGGSVSVLQIAAWQSHIVQSSIYMTWGPGCLISLPGNCNVTSITDTWCDALVLSISLLLNMGANKVVIGSTMASQRASPWNVAGEMRGKMEVGQQTQVHCNGPETSPTPGMIPGG